VGHESRLVLGREQVTVQNRCLKVFEWEWVKEEYNPAIFLMMSSTITLTGVPWIIISSYVAVRGWVLKRRVATKARVT
jgi:hypothetical protein